jgi:hypothetical protein
MKQGLVVVAVVSGLLAAGIAWAGGGEGGKESGGIAPFCYADARSAAENEARTRFQSQGPEAQEPQYVSQEDGVITWDVTVADPSNGKSWKFEAKFTVPRCELKAIYSVN